VVRSFGEQLALGFHILNMPVGLSFQIRVAIGVTGAWRSETGARTNGS
jgi:hypothetical protein